MSEMGLHDPFEHITHKLWPKEGPRVKLAIWLSTIKSQESPQFPCVQVVCDIPLEKLLARATTLPKISSQSKVCTQSYGPPKLRKSQLWEFRPFGNPRTKWHLGAGPMGKYKVYYKGEGDGFPQVQAVVSLVNLSLPVARLSTKSALAMQ
jgi:hypothetical protein